MLVALISEIFCKDMGYLENMLPKHLSRLGVNVHVLATDLSPYYRNKHAQGAYKDFSRGMQRGTVERRDGYTLHILGHREVLGYMRMRDLRARLRSIRPDVVQTLAAGGWIPLEAALNQPFLKYRLFTGCHMTASVFPLANRRLPAWHRDRLRCLFTRGIPGRFISVFTEKCYGATNDCADIAVRFFGVPKDKIDICPLGVDTDLFGPISNHRQHLERLALRRELGFADSDIVCIYSGRFSKDKNPLLLATAVARLRAAGRPYRGLFVGNGAQVDAIESCPGCVTRPFVAVQDLATYFRAADIGVWPTQESMSMLDAAACGLPIIVNHTMAATERIEGNGLPYKLNDVGDLVRALVELSDPGIRKLMGSVGAKKMARDFSWALIAKRRLSDYEAALRHAGNTTGYVGGTSAGSRPSSLEPQTIETRDPNCSSLSKSFRDS